jgi:hypothetical protein
MAVAVPTGNLDRKGDPIDLGTDKPSFTMPINQLILSKQIPASQQIKIILVLLQPDVG